MENIVAAKWEAEKYDFSNLARSVLDVVDGGRSVEGERSDAVHI